MLRATQVCGHQSAWSTDHLCQLPLLTVYVLSHSPSPPCSLPLNSSVWGCSTDLAICPSICAIECDTLILFDFADVTTWVGLDASQQTYSNIHHVHLIVSLWSTVLVVIITLSLQSHLASDTSGVLDLVASTCSVLHFLPLTPQFPSHHSFSLSSLSQHS